MVDRLNEINRKLETDAGLAADERDDLQREAQKLGLSLAGKQKNTGNDLLEKEVEIDSGTFKYVLISYTNSTGAKRYLVRGSAAVEYHYECALPTLSALEATGLQHEVLGGG
eukprot:Selendium_serpulae@DN5293_c0_g2_i1.p1